MSDLWYSPNEFNFSYYQMRWAIPNLLEIEQGVWPKMPPGHVWKLVERATDPNEYKRLEMTIADMQKHAELMRRGGHVSAKFEKACEIASEINFRIKQCGREGQMMKDNLLYGKSNDDLHVTYNLEISMIGDCINDVLCYISGWKRKGDYYDWKEA